MVGTSLHKVHAIWKCQYPLASLGTFSLGTFSLSLPSPSLPPPPHHLGNNPTQSIPELCCPNRRGEGVRRWGCSSPPPVATRALVVVPRGGVTLSWGLCVTEGLTSLPEAAGPGLCLVSTTAGPPGRPGRMGRMGMGWRRWAHPWWLALWLRSPETFVTAISPPRSLPEGHQGAHEVLPGLRPGEDLP